MDTTTISVTYLDPDGAEVTYTTTEQDLWDSYMVTQAYLLTKIYSTSSFSDVKEVSEALRNVAESFYHYKLSLPAV